MTEIQKSQLMKWIRNFRIVILLFPLCTISQQIQQIFHESGNFIVVITLMILAYLGHQFHFNTNKKQQESFKYYLLEQSRKITVCLLSSYLVGYLICEIYYITVNVYKVEYGEQIVFWFRVIVTLSNMEANVQLCDKKHRKHHEYINI